MSQEMSGDGACILTDMCHVADKRNDHGRLDARAWEAAKALDSDHPVTSSLRPPVAVDKGDDSAYLTGLSLRNVIHRSYLMHSKR